MSFGDGVLGQSVISPRAPLNWVPSSFDEADAYVHHSDGCAACFAKPWWTTMPALVFLHSIRHEADFVDSFQALQRAVDLRSQVIDDVFDCRPVEFTQILPVPSPPNRKMMPKYWQPEFSTEPITGTPGSFSTCGYGNQVPVQSSRVRFCDRVHVHFWNAETDVNRTIEVAAPALADLLDTQYGEIFQFDKAAGQSRLTACERSSNPPYKRHFQRRDQRICHPFLTENGAPMDPLSFEAVLIRGGPAIDPPISACHRSDNFYDVPSAWSQHGPENDPNQDDDVETHFFLHEAPDSVQHLFDALQHEGVIFGPRIEDSIFLRSWHIHHLNEPRCWHSRVIELTGHWRFWFGDILSGWRDKNDPNEATIFSVVYPDPPRSGEGREILFDIIISQGLDAPRHSGLITVLQRDDLIARARYSVAASLPDVVSGFQVVQNAEILHECNMHTCTVRHGHVVIPFTMAPLYDMQDGDAFTIAVSSAASSSSGGVVPCQQEEQTVETSVLPPGDSFDFPTAPDDEADDPHANASEDPEDSDDPDSSPSHGVSESDLQGVHIFRLGFPQNYGRLRWDFIEHVIVDAARVVGTPSRQFVGFHYLQATPADQTIHEESIILQHVADIAPGSAEQLILIDIEMHSSSFGHAALQAPRVMRQVHKVVPTLTRSQVLLTARVSAYCEWSSAACLVYHNRGLWPQQDLGPLRIVHGAYLRIVIPPPPFAAWEIGFTLRTFQDTAEMFDQPDASRMAIALLHQQFPSPDHAGSVGLADSNHIMNCKGADLGPYDIDVPTMYAPSAYHRRLRPPHDGTLQWLLDLGQIFATTAEDEAFVDEPLLYVQTWFVNHETFTACRDPRPLRLESQSVTWIDDFRHLWHDRLNRRQPFSLHVVRPTPPQPRSQHYACHVLVEQAIHPARSAVVLSAMLEGDRRDGFIQGAFSIPSHVRQPDIIDIMEIAPFCTGRRCTMHLDDVPIHLVVATEVPSGRSIRIRITNPNLQRPIPPDTDRPHFEDFVFLQTSAIPRQPSESVVNRELNLVEPQCGVDIPSAVSSDTVPESRSFTFRATAPSFLPNARNVHGEPTHIRELWDIFAVHAFSWEGESAAIHVVTWFVDHRHDAPHCFAGRTVALHENFAVWDHQLRSAWREYIDPTQLLEIHVVCPPPPQLEANIVAHVILLQAPRLSWVTSLVSIFDPGRFGSLPSRAAVTTHEQIFLEHLLMTCRYDLSCLQPHSSVHCQAWYDHLVLQPTIPIQGQSGFSIVVQIRRLTADEPSIDMHSLFQGSSSEKKRQVLCLEHCIVTSSDASQLIPLRLLDGEQPSQMPDHVMLEDPICPEDAEQELRFLGFDRHVYLLGNTGFGFCVPVAWCQQLSHETFVYFPLVLQHDDDLVLHTSSGPMDEHAHMAFLHSLGFNRAVIIHCHRVRSGLSLVQYHNNQPELALDSRPLRIATPWPAPMPVIVPKAVFDVSPAHLPQPTHFLDLGIHVDALTKFFRSSHDVLCPWHDHLDLPEITRKSLPCTVSVPDYEVDLFNFDRLVIYTDGSSKSANRRKPPLWVADYDCPDAWAFAVVGERYGTATAPAECVFLGWHAQQVLYESDLPHFLGTDQIGSEFAEREALFWAGIWRLSVNSNIPTFFRSDSVTTVDQAMGRVGCNHSHPTFHALRGVFQALQASLPAGCLAADHVRGRSGDAWNELVDYLAKTEAASGHKLARQQLDLPLLRPALPYLWMIFSQDAGLPAFTGGGFDILPPALPPASDTASQPTPKVASESTVCEFSLSLATLNVGSLFVQPEGHGGKIAYLRAQMHQLGLNMLGLQEARSPAGMSTADDILRLASGAQDGHHGVELWISLRQPIGYISKRPVTFSARHVQVLHSDPRRLFARLAHPIMDCHVLVLHAPQSGRPLQERRAWWQDTQQLVHTFAVGLPLYLLIDANAKTGPAEPPIVFEQDDVISANTEMFRAFLYEHCLCLPCTLASVHPADRTTWTAVDGLSAHRIDYVAVPQAELPRCVHSEVLATLDPGNSFDDHHALQLHWTCPVINRHPGRTSLAPHDRASICAQRDRIALDQVQPGAWSDDIEHHVTTLNQQILNRVRIACPSRRQGPKKPFFTEDVWQLRVAKLHLRKRLQRARRNLSADCLRFTFWAWQTSTLDGERLTHIQSTVDQHDAHVSSTWCAFVHLNCRFYMLARALKQVLKTSRSRQLQAELQAMHAGTAAGEILHRLRPFLGSTNPKKQKKAGLPCVRTQEGHICNTPAEAQDRWIEFFSKMEGGDRVSCAEYRQRWLQSLRDFITVDSCHVSLSDVPCLTDLEAAFRRVAVGKAVGEDNIPPELCRYKAPDMARLCYSVMLKTFLYGQEAAEHKGGRLAVAWKHRGDTRDCSNYRSLLACFQSRWENTP